MADQQPAWPTWRLSGREEDSQSQRPGLGALSCQPPRRWSHIIPCWPHLPSSIQSGGTGRLPIGEPQMRHRVGWGVEVRRARLPATYLQDPAPGPHRTAPHRGRGQGCHGKGPRQRATSGTQLSATADLGKYLLTSDDLLGEDPKSSEPGSAPAGEAVSVWGTPAHEKWQHQPRGQTPIPLPLCKAPRPIQGSPR